MEITISHTTTYNFDHPVGYGVQRLRLTPQSGPTQQVINWGIELEGAEHQLDYTDHLGNSVHLVQLGSGTTKTVIRAMGKVETTQASGVAGRHRGPVPLWFYLRSTSLTEPGEGIQALADEVADIDDALERLHALSGAVADAVGYEPGGTEPTTTAEEALSSELGVCQDHAHIFAAAGRLLDVPCRYVSGYLLLEGEESSTAGHAWAEAHVRDLGWVAFDISNGISADERYVKVATGLDYSQAAPITGTRFGPGDEALSVDLQVTSQQQQPQQQQ